MLGLVGRYLLLKLIATQSAVQRWTFDGQVGFVIADTDAHRVDRGEIPLSDMRT